MAKNAEDRYQSVWGVKADLETCADQLAEIGQIDRIQLGLQDVSGQFQIPQKLYGREKEVAMLLAAFERVACARTCARTIALLLERTIQERLQSGNKETRQDSKSK